MDELERVAVTARLEAALAEIGLYELPDHGRSPRRQPRRAGVGVLEPHPVAAVEVAAEAGAEHAALRGRAGSEPEIRRPYRQLHAGAARDRAAGRAVERPGDRPLARLRRAVDVVDSGLPGRPRALVTRQEEEHPDHVGLAEGERERLPVVARLDVLAHRLRRRGLGARVERGLARRDLGLDAVLAVQDRQRRSALRGAVERLGEQADELVVVGDADRRVEWVGDRRRDARVVRVHVDRQGVHHGLRAAARPVCRSQPLDEGRRGVCRPGAVRAVRAARRDRAAVHRDRRRDRLDRVVGLREEREVGRGRRARSVEPELRQPEAVQVGLVADDHVLDRGRLADDGRGIRGEVGPGLRRQRRRTRSRVHDRHVQTDAVPQRRVAHVPERSVAPPRSASRARASSRLVIRTARNPESRNAVMRASASTSVDARTSSSTAPTTSPGPAVASPGARRATAVPNAVRSGRRMGIR